MAHEHPFRPTDEFRARLERQVLLRHARPSAPVEVGIRSLPRARMVLVVAASLALGATAGFASAQVGRNAQRDSLLAAARAEASLADAQRDLAQALVRDTEQKVRAGLASMEASIQATADLAVAERRRNVLALDIEEITATGIAPRDDLNAPLVDGRDFVRQRIEADAAAAQARLRAAESLQRMADARAQAGAGTGVLDSAPGLDAMVIRAELAVLAEKLALRTEFLKRGTPIEELARRLEAARARQDAGMLEQRLAAARVRLAQVEHQRATGAAGDVDLLRARLAVLELEAGVRGMSQPTRSPP